MMKLSKGSIEITKDRVDLLTSSWAKFTEEFGVSLLQVLVTAKDMAEDLLEVREMAANMGRLLQRYRMQAGLSTYQRAELDDMTVKALKALEKAGIG